MKEIALIVGIFTAIIQLTAGIGLLVYTAEVTSEFNDRYDNIKNGDTNALVDFIENRANDLVNMTIEEVQDILIDSAIKDLSNN